MWPDTLYSLQGLVLCADVEADRSSFDVERVHTVILYQHLSILWSPQLDERLDRRRQTDRQTDRQTNSAACSNPSFWEKLLEKQKVNIPQLLKTLQINTSHLADIKICQFLLRWETGSVWLKVSQLTWSVKKRCFSTMPKRPAMVSSSFFFSSSLGRLEKKTTWLPWPLTGLSIDLSIGLSVNRSSFWRSNIKTISVRGWWRGHTARGWWWRLLPRWLAVSWTGRRWVVCCTEMLGAARSRWPCPELPRDCSSLGRPDRDK